MVSGNGNGKNSGADPAEAADNPAEALVKDSASFVPDGTEDPNKIDERVEVHASISEGMNAKNKTSGTTGSGTGSDGKGRDA